MLGTPSEDEVDFVTDAKAIEYLKSFPHRNRVDFKDIFLAAPPEAIDFLNKTIVFNPKKRLTVDEALNHSLFAKVKDKKKEIVAEGPVVLEFEKEGELGVDRLRELFIQEIQVYKKKK